MAVQKPTGPSEGAATFVRQARRTQIVHAAITTIAGFGLPAASTVAIARRAGVSRGVLTYHFQDRADLLDAVVAEIYRVARAEVSSDVGAAGGPGDALRAFVEGSIDFYVRYPDHMTALSAIFAAGHDRAGEPRDAQGDHHRELDEVGAILRTGQNSGHFRRFDVALMATSIRALLDVALVRVRAGDDPGLLRAELVASIAAMTAAS